MILDTICRIVLRNGNVDSILQKIRDGMTVERVAESLSETPFLCGQVNNCPMSLNSSSDAMRAMSSTSDSGYNMQGSLATPATPTPEQIVQQRLSLTDCEVCNRVPLSFSDVLEVSLARYASGKLPTADMPTFYCDPWICDASDPMSKTIVISRDWARQCVKEGANVYDLIRTPQPELNMFFRSRDDSDPNNAWTWACEIAKTFFYLPYPSQLATVYLTGIQMRVSLRQTTTMWLAC